MKKNFVLLAAITLGLCWTACSDTKGRYVDLRTGEKIEVEKDPQTGIWVDAATKKPVYIYVDTKNNDTIYGKTGAVINGRVVTRDNVYWYDADLDNTNNNSFETKSGDYKMEVEKDGDVKIKNGDQKIKIDGETGEKKVKND